MLSYATLDIVLLSLLNIYINSRSQEIIKHFLYWHLLVLPASSDSKLWKWSGVDRGISPCSSMKKSLMIKSTMENVKIKFGTIICFKRKDACSALPFQQMLVVYTVHIHKLLCLSSDTQNGWDREGPLKVTWSTLNLPHPPQARQTRASCPGSCPDDFWICPRMETL